MTTLAVKEFGITVIILCRTELACVPRMVICWEIRFPIKTIYFHVCQRPQKMCVSYCVFYSYLYWTKVIGQRCSFPDRKGTEERVVSKHSRCYCGRMWNVFSVRPCAWRPSILAGWKKHSKNKGSPAEENRHGFTWKTIRRHRCASAEWTEDKQWSYHSSEYIFLPKIHLPTSQTKAPLLKRKHNSAPSSCSPWIPPTDTSNEAFPEQLGFLTTLVLHYHLVGCVGNSSCRGYGACFSTLNKEKATAKRKK